MSRHVLEQLPVESYEKTIILQDRAKEGKCHDTTTTAMFIHHIQVLQLCIQNFTHLSPVMFS